MIRNEADTTVLKRVTMDVPNGKAETGGRSGMTNQELLDRIDRNAVYIREHSLLSEAEIKQRDTYYKIEKEHFRF